MEHRSPSHEELLDLSWLLDSALVAGNRRRAIDFASRLLDSLHRHQQGMTGCASEAGSTTTGPWHACVTLSTDVASVLTWLRRGDMRRVEFRHRVEALALSPVQPASSTAERSSSSCRVR